MGAYWLLIAFCKISIAEFCELFWTDERHAEIEQNATGDEHNADSNVRLLSLFCLLLYFLCIFVSFIIK